MRYLETINLWAPGITEALRSGQLKLQRGQWVRCGSVHPSRFFGVSKGGSIWAAHWDGSSSRQIATFNSWVANERLALTRKAA